MDKELVRQNAFTLSEVLLVLSVIGVVAALTIPTLTTSLQDQQFKTGYKKAFSIASQAINMIKASNTNFENSGGDCGYAANKNNFNSMMSKLNTIKSCFGDVSGCWDSTGEKYYNTHPGNNSVAYIDSSGVAWTTIDDCGGFIADTNGNKPPNKYGQDRFPFTWDTVGSGGIPSKINIYPDKTGTALDCPSGSCWYTSWLTGAK